MDRIWKILTIMILVLLLFGVRAFENELFYDPFLYYFKSDYLEKPLPGFESGDLFFGMTFRYFLNTMLSLGIIYVLFPDAELLRFTSVLYVILFVVLISIFFGLLFASVNGNNFLLFYVRRFLIQPLFLLLFVPAFYYQKRLAKK
ncbi:MAG: exosortase F system-associated protein [Flavobacterium sp.]|uniref:exosortase F system-associated membrane protein n=1 Tax=Flavobacterium sp. TaxID=239 RepID=UPI0012234D88|nr:exosortase F system-associated protein [Flavobacterium sp.]RZJ67158.1 MAG: exosortase F system-associated protein [Flavobacterium sp.]